MASTPESAWMALLDDVECKEITFLQPSFMDQVQSIFIKVRYIYKHLFIQKNRETEPETSYPEKENAEEEYAARVASFPRTKLQFFFGAASKQKVIIPIGYK